jgi:hypothetical protein
MPSNVLLRHARNDLDFLCRLIDQSKSNGSPQIEGPVRLSTDEYCDVLTLVIGFSRSYRETVDTELQRVFTARPQSFEQIQQVRAELENLADRYRAMAHILQNDADLAAVAARHPGLGKMLAKLGQAVDELGRCKSDLIRDWPVASPQEWAAILQENHGSFQPVDAAFADMKGISPAELHRQLAEHKARRKEYGWE